MCEQGGNALVSAYMRSFHLVVILQCGQEINTHSDLHFAFFYIIDLKGLQMNMDFFSCTLHAFSCVCVCIGV